MPKQISDGSFEADVIEASKLKPVVVDFWAEWCAPCKQIAPALEEIDSEMSDKVTITKINIDENPSSPATYAVRGIPTLIMFKDGQIAATKTGALPKSKLVEWIESEI